LEGLTAHSYGTSDLDSRILPPDEFAFFETAFSYPVGHKHLRQQARPISRWAQENEGDLARQLYGSLKHLVDCLSCRRTRPLSAQSECVKCITSNGDFVLFITRVDLRSFLH
jgi:hypothetical protein